MALTRAADSGDEILDPRDRKYDTTGLSRLSGERIGSHNAPPPPKETLR